MKITLVTVGKIKEKYLKDAIAEYSKRLSKYCKLEIIEVADEKTPDQASEVVENGIRAKEAERIMKYIKEDSYVVTLEIQGKMLSSEELASKIDQLGIQGKSHITFVIGGSIGLGEAVLKRSDFALSFSKMDIPPSVDARDSSGTNLSKLSDQFQRALPQIRRENKGGTR